MAGNSWYEPSAPQLEVEEVEDGVTSIDSKLSKQCSLSSETVPSAPSIGKTSFVNPVTQVELTISASSLLNLDQVTRSDPLCVVFFQDSTTVEEWVELGRTETILDNLNPEWKTKFVMDYRFEERQFLTFMIYDKDCKKYSLESHDFLGKLDCTLGEVVSSPNSKLTRSLSLPSIHASNSRGSTITIVSEEIGECKKTIYFQLRYLAPATRGKHFITISKQIADGSWILLHRTDRIPTATCAFPDVYIRYSSICKMGNLETPLRFERHLIRSQSFRGKSSEWAGAALTNFIAIAEGCQKTGSTCLNLHTNAINFHDSAVGTLEILNFQVQMQKTFVDYLSEGLKLNFTVAIDFTASNGDPNRHASLHYRHGKTDNPYVMTLKYLGEILQEYSSCQKFNAHGFGAKGFPVSNRVNHKFALNFRESNPTCQGIEGILTAYYRALQRVKLYGPTCFAPIIREVTEIAKSSIVSDSAGVEGNYFVLLILTDGNVCDPETTVDALVEAANVPLSVIIIGIGDEDFSAMEKLDSDEKLLLSRSKKKRASRDILQFVELRKFINVKSMSPVTQGAKIALARSVLAELPHQVVSWMHLKPKLNPESGVGMY